MNKLVLLLSLLLSISAHAGDEVLYGTKISKVFAMSEDGSSAHLIQLERSMGNSCSQNRLYISFEDEALFSSALANHMADKTVDVIYNVDAPKKLARSHVETTCKLISIF